MIDWRIPSVGSGECLGKIEGIHSQALTKVLFSADGQYIFTAGDKHIRIFHNVPGIKINIQVGIFDDD